MSEHLKQESTSKNEIYTMISMGEQNLNDMANFFKLLCVIKKFDTRPKVIYFQKNKFICVTSNSDDEILRS